MPLFVMAGDLDKQMGG